MSLDRHCRLRELGLVTPDGQNPEIKGISLDSREIGPGWMFAALPGSRLHGAKFAAEAISRGAVAVLTDRDGAALINENAEEDADHRTLIIAVKDAREALARSASLFFGGQPEITVGVTGTNGKTSVANFTRQIFQALGQPSVNIGTIGVEGDHQGLSTRHTTPDAVSLHRLLAQLGEDGITHAAMEASSHGLDQRRLDGVELSAAGFTNLTQDHLDYHGDMENYFRAKKRLFMELLPDGSPAVIHLGDEYGARLAAELARMDQHPVLTVGASENAALRLISRRYQEDGQELRLSFLDKFYQIRLPLIGDFQVENALIAAGLAISVGSDAEEVFQAIGKLQGVRGRMQLVAKRSNGAPVFVDYAHTPDAVARALQALRPHVMGKIVAVLGAGGDRDRGKRSLMGQAAAKFADEIIVTDDNPRNEDPGEIRRSVMAGVGETAQEIADRAEAILTAADMLEAGDAALIAGKGHETGQIVGNITYPFDDAEAASIAVAALEGRA